MTEEPDEKLLKIAQVVAASADRLNGFLKRVENSPLWKKVIFVALLLLMHLAISLYSKDFGWLSAGGGLITILGLLAIFSEAYFSSLDTDKMKVYLEGTPEIVRDFGSFWGEYTPDSEKAAKLNERRSQFIERYRNVWFYLLVTILGTLIWAYSSFLNSVFFPVSEFTANQT
ncbi:hypothetical protein DFO83_104221 [Idiomarina loihiensis]|uniref:hypothetical protein n=1 Tax=Idiomarina TaxID=135575 RepID=UPI0002DC58BB|nr:MULTISPECIES: hypothetical protein [Idiomarina]NWO03856.1 hypothetical protein [Idiomarinaceae bacterium]PWW38521.1 hypothetical protein DFO83_104221 [Idiomarina loihiensis]TDP48405.1 hypothetical protein DET58_10482 [Idiomarina loihiensis]TDS23571.1 hypothetical protein DET62_10482 [Idiomarina sp. H2]